MSDPPFASDPLAGLGGPITRRAAGYWFALRRGYYRLRYPQRLDLGPGVIIAGRLRLVGATRLTLGAHSIVRQSMRVDGGGVVTIGSHTRVNGDCWIGAHRRVDIGERCLISDCCIVDSDFHNLDPAQRHLPPLPEVSAPIHIADNVWIGTRALVLKGSVIGTDAVVGAGAVVRGAVPAGSVAVGNPATVVRTFAPHDRTVVP